MISLTAFFVTLGILMTIALVLGLTFNSYKGKLVNYLQQNSSASESDVAGYNNLEKVGPAYVDNSDILNSTWLANSFVPYFIRDYKLIATGRRLQEQDAGLQALVNSYTTMYYFYYGFSLLALVIVLIAILLSPSLMSMFGKIFNHGSN